MSVFLYQIDDSYVCQKKCDVVYSCYNQLQLGSGGLGVMKRVLRLSLLSLFPPTLFPSSFSVICLDKAGVLNLFHAKELTSNL